MTVSNWDKFYHKGKGYMQSLDQRLQDPKAQDANQLSKDELYSEYDVRRQTITGERLTAIDGVKKSDRFYGIIADYKEHESLYYHNFFGTRPGVIIAAENKGYFKGDGKSTPERWSAVIGSLWAQVCAEDNQPISGLRRLVRTTIENEETKDVLQEAFDRAKVNMDPSSKSRVMRTFTRKDEAFYAIIGTPNGNGVPWLLKTNADRLGKKTITSIAVYANLDPTDSTIWLWDLIFAIEKASAEESSADRAHQETGANADPPEVDPDNDYSDDCGCSGLSCLIL
ncbi:hypothetical protein N7492_009253 [Penicillium capsulatum]|uniref:Uncharacterized protein n=1 Tax=Penicillium capsulatum TaxID=69766 RepID=A0A9W9HUI6_9EURO|nr:hypothetical protein N7492_009253 [Penicillium capsulatum]